MESFGSLLRRHRLEAGLTQDLLAEKAALSVHAVSTLERGSRRRPRPDTAEALATALNLTGEDRDAFLVASLAGRDTGRDPGHARPHELPPDVSPPAGRDDLLAEAETLLTGRPAVVSVPRIVCLYGVAGTGKTLVAVHLAHRVVPSYPDGQLFVRLRDRDGAPADVNTVLDRLLRSLGVPADQGPETVEERSALLRSVLRERAVLLVLDDVAGVGQVRPLLPAGERCAVVTTSRLPLVGLESAVHRELDLD